MGLIFGVVTQIFDFLEAMRSLPPSHFRMKEFLPVVSEDFTEEYNSVRSSVSSLRGHPAWQWEAAVGRWADLFPDLRVTIIVHNVIFFRTSIM